MSTLTLVNTCPEWCTLPLDHDLPERLPGDGRLHEGPSFGPFRAAAYEAPSDDGRPYMLGGDHNLTDDLGPAELRAFAAEALAAAEWLEAQT